MNISAPFIKNSLFVVAVLVAVQCVFAVTGKRMSNSGDDKTKSSENAVAFSNIKSSVTFSLKDRYNVSVKNNRNLNFNASSQVKQQNVGTLISFRKGNVTYVLPYKTQSGVKLPGFIKMCPSQTTAR